MMRKQLMMESGRGLVIASSRESTRTLRERKAFLAIFFHLGFTVFPISFQSSRLSEQVNIAVTLRQTLSAIDTSSRPRINSTH